MEDVLEVYTRPYDERFAQVCLDEKSKSSLWVRCGSRLPPVRGG
jgi:hypothetical protein